MKIFNTMSSRLEDFKPIVDGKVSIYVCGPTVYDFIHIGNARPMIVFDTLRRYLTYLGYDVNYVSNFTDVDDKIIKRANEEGVSSDEIAQKYIEECKKDMADLNMLPATFHPKATEEIDGMIDLISTLIEKGYAYEKNGTVYYRTRSFKEYGKLSHKDLDELRSGERSILVSGEGEKEDPLDFVLWKPKKEGEPFWKSPWGDGRPGWHTECCVMSKKYLGENIDIHAGGEDLIFPHHENEIAQSEAANGTTFSKYWMHNAFLNINNHKMSKSLGNFFTVRDIGKQYDLNILRFLMLSAHYKTPLNFSSDQMEQAKAARERIIECVRSLNAKIDNSKENNIANNPDVASDIEGFINQFKKAMDNDLNTADAIAAIFDLVKYTNKTIDNISISDLEALKNTILQLCDVLGLIVEEKEDKLEDELQGLINQRIEAKKNKDFELADKLRDELRKKGIEIKDTRNGVEWKRI